MSPTAGWRMLLAAERRRGTPFAEAWDGALARIGRDDWCTALEWSRDEWQAAYERRQGRFDALGPFESERVRESAEVLA